MCCQSTVEQGATDVFVHDGLWYRGTDDLVRRVREFVEQGFATAEPVLIALPAENLEAVREALGGAADRVRFEDMRVVCRNPSRIVSLFGDWSTLHGGSPVRLVSQSLWAERSEAALYEAARNEALLNLAFAGTEMIVACPYDADRFAGAVLDGAGRTHRRIAERDGDWLPSPGFVEADQLLSEPEPVLPDPAVPTEILDFDGDLSRVRHFIADGDTGQAFSDDRRADFVFAINEIATNVVRHGHGEGRLRIWREDGDAIGEVRGPGWITDPLAGRRRPAIDAPDGRGLWLVNQLADLVQTRSSVSGTTVRVHMHPDLV
jgi:anti-sigma regulatory factor (Ser/Thr protein kinase)